MRWRILSSAHLTVSAWKRKASVTTTTVLIVSVKAKHSGEERGNCFRVRDLAGGLRSSHHPNDALVSLVGPFHHPTWIGAREMIYPSTTWTNLLVLTDWYNGKDLGWNQELWVQFRAVSWDKFLNAPQLQFSHLKGVRMKWDEVKKGTNSNCRALSPL